MPWSRAANGRNKLPTACNAQLFPFDHLFIQTELTDQTFPSPGWRLRNFAATRRD
jgi:hypothetical protein